MGEKESFRERVLESIMAAHNEEVNQGDILKELANSKKRQNEYMDEAFICGAHYFTDKKLEQIKKDADEFLFRNLDINDIKTKITNSAEPNLEELSRLIFLENKIAEIKDKKANDFDSLSEKHNFFSSLIIDLVDSINGGDRNES